MLIGFDRSTYVEQFSIVQNINPTCFINQHLAKHPAFKFYLLIQVAYEKHNTPVDNKPTFQFQHATIWNFLVIMILQVQAFTCKCYQTDGGILDQLLQLFFDASAFSLLFTSSSWLISTSVMYRLLPSLSI